MRRCVITLNGEYEEKHIEKELGWFHEFCTESRVIPPSPLNGGHNGGQVSHTLAIVEDSEHRLRRVFLEDIQFCDNPENAELTPCEYFEKSKEPNLGLDNCGKWEKGWLVKWSESYDEYENGPGIFPAAVIKDEKGEIHVVYAEHVRFNK